MVWPLFRAGETVTCENGHEMYRTAAAWDRHAALRTSFFVPTSPEVQAPTAGTKIRDLPRCPRCLGAWIRVLPFKLEIHFAEGWRPAA